MIFFLLPLIFSKSEDFHQRNKEMHELLSSFIKTRCLSKIQINLDEPCENKELMKRCKYDACKVIREKEESKKQTLCRTGTAINDGCEFIAENDPQATFVDLDVAMQIYSGYKDGAKEIWLQIYEIAGRDNVLYNLISGIHFSISIHMSTFYKHINKEYYANPMLYYSKKRDDYVNNLIFTHGLVLLAVSLIKENNYRCSMEIDKEDLLNMNKILKYLGRTIGNNNIRKKNVVDRGDLKKIMEFDTEHSLHYLLQDEYEYKNDSKIFEMSSLEDNRKMYSKLFPADYLNRLKEINKVTNCIECDKCKLWGKLQFDGLKTAIRILVESEDTLLLKGSELVNLFHLLHKLTSALVYMNLLDQIKWPRLYYLLMFWIEILTVFLSLTLFYTVNRLRKRRKSNNLTKK